MMGLTKRQAECLAFIADRYKVDGVSPSYDEIAAHMGLRSRAGINRIIKGLEARGALLRIPNKARALCPVELPGRLTLELSRELEQRLHMFAAALRQSPAELAKKILSDHLIRHRTARTSAHAHSEAQEWR